MLLLGEVRLRLGVVGRAAGVALVGEEKASASCALVKGMVLPRIGGDDDDDDSMFERLCGSHCA